MILRWWKRYLDGIRAGVPSEPDESDHSEICPFCDETFDMRDLRQVLEHFDHQLTAGAPPAIALTPDEDLAPHQRKVVPFRRRREG